MVVLTSALVSDTSSTIWVMKTVTKRELNQNTASVLDHVTEDEDVVVTQYGKPRWRVSAVREQGTVLDRLERDGRYTPPVSEPVPWPERPEGPGYTDLQIDALLDDVRGDH